MTDWRLTASLRVRARPTKKQSAAARPIMATTPTEMPAMAPLGKLEPPPVLLAAVVVELAVALLVIDDVAGAVLVYTSDGCEPSEGKRSPGWSM
jgi:hypothetical protein